MRAPHEEGVWGFGNVEAQKIKFTILYHITYEYEYSQYSYQTPFFPGLLTLVESHFDIPYPLHGPPRVIRSSSLSGMRIRGYRSLRTGPARVELAAMDMQNKLERDGISRDW